jgi:hypothetical protein
MVSFSLINLQKVLGLKNQDRRRILEQEAQETEDPESNQITSNNLLVFSTNLRNKEVNESKFYENFSFLPPHELLLFD